MADVKITLKKSLIGCKKPQIATAEALGLHKVLLRIWVPAEAWPAWA